MVVYVIIGIDWQSENKIVSAAEMCFSRNVFFDELERFFLVSCLALWYVVSHCTNIIASMLTF